MVRSNRVDRAGLAKGGKLGKVSKSCILGAGFFKGWDAIQSRLFLIVLYLVKSYFSHLYTAFVLFPSCMCPQSPTMSLIIILGSRHTLSGSTFIYAFNNKHPMQPHAGNLAVLV